MGAGHQAMIRSLELSVPPSFSRELTNPSCLCDEAPRKISEVWGSESSWVTEHMEMLRGCCLKEVMTAPHPSPRPFPYASLPSGCSGLYPFIINWYFSKQTVPLSSMSHPSKLSNPRREL